MGTAGSSAEPQVRVEDSGLWWEDGFLMGNNDVERGDDDLRDTIGDRSSVRCKVHEKAVYWADTSFRHTSAGHWVRPKHFGIRMRGRHTKEPWPWLLDGEVRSLLKALVGGDCIR